MRFSGISREKWAMAAMLMDGRVSDDKNINNLSVYQWFLGSRHSRTFVIMQSTAPYDIQYECHCYFPYWFCHPVIIACWQWYMMAKTAHYIIIWTAWDLWGDISVLNDIICRVFCLLIIIVSPGTGSNCPEHQHRLDPRLEHVPQNSRF